MRNTPCYHPGMLWLLAAALAFSACSSSKKVTASKKAGPHEQYATRISEAGLSATTLGRLWFAAAEKALVRPLSITLPYRETGYFAAEKPDAAGYSFAVKRGEQVNIVINVKPPTNFLLFAELWQSGEAGAPPSLLATADTISRQIRFEVKRDARLLLRLQPELLRSGEYTVGITTSPTLAFPVQPNASYKIISLWGDGRDKGGRKHEGIDIQGKLRTPVVAAADGYVNSVRENSLGGKVVFLQADGKDYTLYYAHLDSQLVREGQRLRTGDPVGLMGNTGNARNTVTHLHFGIYAAGGAIDPLPFVNTEKQSPAAVTASLGLLQQSVRNTVAATLRGSPEKNATIISKLSANQVMQVLAATGNWYKVTLPDMQEGFIESKAVSDQSYLTLVLKRTEPLLDAPDSATAVKTTMPEGSSVNIVGGFGDYQYIRYKTLNGWMKQPTTGGSN